MKLSLLWVITAAVWIVTAICNLLDPESLSSAYNAFGAAFNAAVVAFFLFEHGE